MCLMVKRTNGPTNDRTNERLNKQMHENELTNVWTTTELGYIFAFMYFVDDVVGGCVAMVL